MSATESKSPRSRTSSEKSNSYVGNKSIGAHQRGAEEPTDSQDQSKPAGQRVNKNRARHATIKSTDKPRLFVLDTNVLMHDPSALFRFQEHDVFLPMMTLEELDNHKSGVTEVSRNVRAVSRTLDSLIAASGSSSIMDGLPLSALGNTSSTGKLYFQSTDFPHEIFELSMGKADNQILNVVAGLQRKNPEKHVVLVSKDINMRIKASAIKLAAEDYFNDQVLQDTDLLYSGHAELPEYFWDALDSTETGSREHIGITVPTFKVSGKFIPNLLINQYVFDGPETARRPFHAKVIRVDGNTAELMCLKDFTGAKNNIWGVVAKNNEQNFALNLLMDDQCDFVTLLGQAGTGKTLLALAAGLTQVLDTKKYAEILISRATVPVGDDIGFLPGTEEEKMAPWMGAFDDNLEVLCKSDPEAGEWGRKATNDVIKSKIKIKSMSFMRGRTFVNKFVIIDEAQNLTAKEAKTLISRSGPGTKMIFLGNIAQIDTPWLTEGSSGLTHVVDRFKGWQHGGHITLTRGERSRLADHANEVL